MKGFPMVVYHASHPTLLIGSAAELAALGSGWFESPDLVTEPVVAEPVPSVEPVFLGEPEPETAPATEESVFLSEPEPEPEAEPDEETETDKKKPKKPKK